MMLHLRGLLCAYCSENSYYWPHYPYPK